MTNRQPDSKSDRDRQGGRKVDSKGVQTERQTVRHTNLTTVGDTLGSLWSRASPGGNRIGLLNVWLI